MVVNPLKVLLFLAGGSVAAGATAYVSGALDPYIYGKGAGRCRCAGAAPDPAAPKDERLPGDEPPATMAAEPPPATTAEPPATMAAVTPPADDAAAQPPATMRRAAAGRCRRHRRPALPADLRRRARRGRRLRGRSPARQRPMRWSSCSAARPCSAARRPAPEGDFAIVLDEPLKPGDYQITLRATSPDGAVVASLETAVLSIPETPGGQVLAMVEQPGEPSEITDRAAAGSAGGACACRAQGRRGGRAAGRCSRAEDRRGSSAAGRDRAAAARRRGRDPAGNRQPAPAPAPAEVKVTVEAVEIEGRKIFVAGSSEPGRTSAPMPTRSCLARPGFPTAAASWSRPSATCRSATTSSAPMCWTPTASR